MILRCDLQQLSPSARVTHLARLASALSCCGKHGCGVVVVVVSHYRYGMTCTYGATQQIEDMVFDLCPFLAVGEEGPIRVRATMPAGSAAVFDLRVLHRGLVSEMSE